MRKLFLKSMLLLCALIVGSTSLWGTTDEWTYTFNASSGITKGANTINSVSWNIDHDSQYSSNDAAGYHVGSSSKTVSYLQLSTSGISGTISKIVVNAKGNGTGGTISASVNSSAYTAKDGNNSITNTATDFEFTGNSSGEIVIRLEYSEAIKKNFFVSSISVTYEATPKTDPTITFNDGYVNVANTLDVSILFTSNSTGAVTYSITAGGSYATLVGSTLTGVAEGEVTVQASQAATISYNAKNVTANITVGPYVQPTQFDISLNNSFFGTSYGGSASGITDENPVSGELNNVTVTYAGSGNHYINASQIRFYPSNKLTFEAPAGYIITKIVFTSAGTWTATINSDKGAYNSSSKTWQGVASSVLFTGSGSGRCDMSKAAITLSNAYSRDGLTAGNWGTICLPYAVSAGNIEGATFYSIIGKDATDVYLESVSALVAGKPYIFQASASSLTLALNFAESAASVAGSDNGLHGTFVDVDFEDPFDEENTYIIYNNQVRKASDKSGVDAYRAYIEIDEIVGGAPAAPGRPIIQMPYESNNATDIQNIETKDDAIKFIENGQLFIKKNNGVVYDVLGRIIK